MAYARMGNDSSVYIYMDVRGHLHCCFCDIFQECFMAYSTDEMVEHVQQHIERGDDVPDYLIPDLWEDDRENFPEDRCIQLDQTIAPEGIEGPKETD